MAMKDLTPDGHRCPWGRRTAPARSARRRRGLARRPRRARWTPAGPCSTAAAARWTPPRPRWCRSRTARATTPDAAPCSTPAASPSSTPPSWTAPPVAPAPWPPWRRVRHPVQAARAVLEHSDHVLMVGAGAEAIAQEAGAAMVDPAHHVVEKPAPPLGTVGAVALDYSGNLAAATSTGGTRDQAPGRVGDTPLVGAGTYADARCAISATGHGEAIIRAVAGHDVAARLRAGDALDRGGRGGARRGRRARRRGGPARARHQRRGGAAVRGRRVPPRGQARGRARARRRAGPSRSVRFDARRRRGRAAARPRAAAPGRPAPERRSGGRCRSPSWGTG